MNSITASRLNGVSEYYFSKKLREIEELNRSGKKIINLGIGSPDLPPHPDVIQTLVEEARRPDVHAYQSYKGSPVLRNALGEWYKKWYRVDLNPDTEILPLMGSKEGIMHICMTYVNPGDLVLVPDPGYPTYRSAATLAGANVCDYSLLETEGWTPDFVQLSQLLKGVTRDRPTLMFVNYPQMPTGAVPPGGLFEKLVDFAKEFNLLLVHDNPYSFILNEHPASLLHVPGAKEVAMELNSLSKSHNMAGWRVGVLCASAGRIEEVLRFKSNMDSGMFLPVQLAAAKALSLPESWYEELNVVYRARREKVFRMLSVIGCSYDENQSGMFVWAKVPDLFSDGFELSDEILYRADVFLTPGGIFGKAGQNYIRISLCSAGEKLDQALERILEWKAGKASPKTREKENS